MPLYKHKSGEQRQVVTGGAEDQRLAGDKRWSLVKHQGKAGAEQGADDQSADDPDQGPDPTEPHQETP